MQDDALNQVTEPETSVAVTRLDPAATSSTAAVNAATAWLAKIPADQTVVPKKQIVEAFQRLLDLFDMPTGAYQDVASRVGAFIVKALDNKLQTIALSPQQDSCHIAILSPNHEFYRVLVLPTKQADKFMRYLELLEPQLKSDEIRLQYYQFLAYSLAMSPHHFE